MLKEVSLERIIVLLLLCATIFLFPYILWWIDHKVFRGKIWKFLENPKNDIQRTLIDIPSFIYWNIIGMLFLLLIFLLLGHIFLLLGITPTNI